MRSWRMLTVGLLVLCACGSRRAAAPAPAATGTAPELETLEQGLDRLEERLLADAATVRFWRELRERHESVSAIAAVNLERHADKIAVLETRQKDKAVAQAKGKRLAKLESGGQGGP